MEKAMHVEAGQGGSEMTAVVLAGGKATRLRPLSLSRPKGMVPVLNRPFMEHVLAYFQQYGITKVVLALGHEAEPLREHFGDGSRFGVSIEYSVEEEPLGTAGAVKKLEASLHDTFIVYNGDVYTTIPLDEVVAVHRAREAIATIALTPVDDPSQYGVVETDDRGSIRRFIEKPKPGMTSANSINAGIYVLEPGVFRHMNEGFVMFEIDVFPSLLKAGAPFYAHDYDAYWIDIGTPEKYRKLNLDLADCIESGQDINGRPTEPRILIAPDVLVHPSAMLLPPAVIGPGTTLMEDAFVHRSVLWEGCMISERATVRDSVLADRCVVGPHSSVSRCILGEGTHIPADSVVSDLSMP
jgi:mannose-1-phosphate guanylyltransferase